MEDVNFYEMIFSSNISNLKNKILCNVWVCEEDGCRILFKLGTRIKQGIHIKLSRISRFLQLWAWHQSSHHSQGTRAWLFLKGVTDDAGYLQAWVQLYYMYLSPCEVMECIVCTEPIIGGNDTVIGRIPDNAPDDTPGDQHQHFGMQFYLQELFLT